MLSPSWTLLITLLVLGTHARSASPAVPPAPRLIFDSTAGWEPVFVDAPEAMGGSRCDDRDIVDSMPIAVHNPKHEQTVLWTSTAGGTRISVGNTLDSVTRNCSAPLIWNSTTSNGEDCYAPTRDPSTFANCGWPQCVTVLPNGSVVAIIHNEFDNADQADYWSTGVGISDDIGREPIRLVAEPPAHRALSLPYKWNSSFHKVAGFGAIGTALMPGDDGALYGLVHASGVKAQQTGHCAFRTSAVEVPSSFRGWRASNNTFSVRFVDAYKDHVTSPADHVCDPVPGLASTKRGNRVVSAPEHASPRKLRDFGKPWPKYAMLTDFPAASAEKRAALQIFYSFESDYSKAVTSWTASQELVLQGIERWIPLGAPVIVNYPTWMDSSAPLHGDFAYSSISNTSQANASSLYVYVAINMPKASILRRRAVFLPPGSPAPPTPPQPKPTPSTCNVFRVVEAGVAAINGLYFRVPSQQAIPSYRQQGTSDPHVLAWDVLSGLWRLERSDGRVVYVTPDITKQTLPAADASWTTTDKPLVQCTSKPGAKCETSFNVSGAGLTTANGLYSFDAASSTYIKEGTALSIYRAGRLWHLGHYSVGVFYTTVTPNATAPPMPGDWVCSDCSTTIVVAPAPQSVRCADEK